VPVNRCFVSIPLFFVRVGFSFEGLNVRDATIKTLLHAFARILAQVLRLNVRDATIKTLLLQKAEFALGQIKPTAVFGRVMKLELSGNSSCLLRRKCFVKGSDPPMGVELIANLRVQANANIICQIRSAKENLECGKISV
jgi:hypothetical protein